MPTPISADQPATPRDWTECTECQEGVLGGFTWRERYGHLRCLVPHLAESLMSDTLSLVDAQIAADLLVLFMRERLATFQRRDRHAALANDLRQIVGLPPAGRRP